MKQTIMDIVWMIVLICGLLAFPATMWIAMTADGMTEGAMTIMVLCGLLVSAISPAIYYLIAIHEHTSGRG